MARRPGSVRAARKATSRQHNASRRKLMAKFQAPRSCRNDVRVNSEDGTRERHVHERSCAECSRNPVERPAPEFGWEISSVFRHGSRHGKLSVHVARASGTCTMLELVQAGKMQD